MWGKADKMVTDIVIGGLTLSDWASIATILESAFFILSVGFIWYQLHQNSRLLRSANAQALVGLSSPLNMALIQDRQVAEYWLHGAAQYDAMDDVEKDRFRSLLFWWVNLHENIYYQHERHLLDDASYEPWDYDLKKFVILQELWRFWPDLGPYLQAKFAGHVKGLIDVSLKAKSAN